MAGWCCDRLFVFVAASDIMVCDQARTLLGWSQNRILFENYFLPGDIEAHIEAFVDHHSQQRYHESLNNVTPSDVYSGRDKVIIQQRERIKKTR